MWLRDQTRRTGVRSVKRQATATLLAAILMIVAVPASTDDTTQTILYFFVQDGCPACARMKPAIDDIAAEYERLTVHTLEVSGTMEYRVMLLEAAQAFSIERLSVPAVFLGDRVWIGYGESAVRQIREEVDRCLDEGCADTFELVAAALAADAPEAPARTATAGGADVPSLFGVSADELPLVASTAAIAFLDGFNPCSLWVLTFLLAMVMHTGSRRRVLLVGTVFLVVTATIYGLFIVGIVQAVALLAHVPWIRIIVVVLALAMGAINIKDYFAFKKGVSLTISAARQSRIAKRFAGLSRSTQSPGMLIATTAGMAAGIAIIELPCTAGFPVVWSNLVAAAAVPWGVFALLLTVYIAIYLLIEIVLVVSATVAFRKVVITERGGRLLKLFGGAIMVALAFVLLLAPELMESLVSMLIVFASAGGLAALIAVIDRLIRSSAGQGSSV